MKTYYAKKTEAPLTLADPRWEAVPAAEQDFRWEDCDPSPYKTAFRLVHSKVGVTIRL